MTKANSVFSLISCISSNTGSSKIKKVGENTDFLSLVAGTGFISLFLKEMGHNGKLEQQTSELRVMNSLFYFSSTVLLGSDTLKL